VDGSLETIKTNYPVGGVWPACGGVQFKTDGRGSAAPQWPDLQGETTEVDIRQGDAYRVVTDVEENAAPCVQVVADGDTLRIGLDPDETYHMINIDLWAEVTLPELTRLVLDGGSDATISGLKSVENLDVALDLGSALQGNIEAGDISVDAALGGDVILSGSARDLNGQPC
jgi:hypothetical protein